jgi:RNA polymerase sigma-70 factor (ECF subfamily)
MNELQLVVGCKKREGKAQKALFDAYSYAMLLLCLRYVRNQADAEEMMLNGFYKFFTNIEQFTYTGTGSIAPWLKKIMINECLMFLRKKGRLQIIDEEHAAELAANDEIIGRLSADEIFELITTLPTGYRTVFNLFVVEGMGHKEIAALLNITEGTSKSQLNKARIMLQKEMRKRGMYYEK